jgi:hypothetical protein
MICDVVMSFSERVHGRDTGDKCCLWAVGGGCCFCDDPLDDNLFVLYIVVEVAVGLFSFATAGVIVILLVILLGWMEYWCRTL